jgi:hypothetical protein
MAEMAQDIAEVQARHGDLRDTHLEEGSERAEDTLLALLHTESRSRGEVAALHDTTLVCYECPCFVGGICVHIYMLKVIGLCIVRIFAIVRISSALSD